MFEDFLEYFKSVKDFRLNRKKLYPLEEMLLVTLSATICGCDDWVEISEYGKAKLYFLKNYLAFENGIASDDTFRRVFSYLDWKVFQECFIKWVSSLQESHAVHIAIDGKCLRGSGSLSNEVSPLHLLSAFSSEMRLVLGQSAVSEKSNEITAIPKLLKLLNIENSVITIDAMGCQKHITQEIISQKGHYILALKNNQKSLYKDVIDYFNDDILTNNLGSFTTIDKEHGRLETRTIRQSSDISWLVNRHEGWANFSTIIEISSTREIKGKTSQQKRYYISDLQTYNAEELLQFIRSHWAIENKLHWILDVVFHEDNNQSYLLNQQKNLAIIRHTALNLIQKYKPLKMSVKTARKIAPADDNLLKNILNF